MTVSLLLGCCALLSMQPVAAEIVDVSAAGFKLRFEICFEQPASIVYQTILDLESWWDPDHTYSGDAANLKLDLRPGGYTPSDVEAIAKPVDEVWAGHLARFEVAVNARGG